MNDKSMYICGIGHNSVAIMDLVEDCGFKIAGLLHYNNDRIGESYFDYEIGGCFEDILDRPTLEGMNFALSMGDIPLKKQLYNRIIEKGGSVPALIHPTAVVSKRTVVKNGVMIMPQSIIQADVVIGENTVITMNTTVAHSTIIGKHCFVSGHCLIGAYINIEDEVQIGQDCTLVSGTVTNVGIGSILGAGSVLRSDMKSNAIYLGNPARFIKMK